MAQFTLHDETTAPEASKALLAGQTKAWGFTPKLHATLAESPAALGGYVALFDLVKTTSLTPVEQQVVYQAVNVLHACEYCTAGHTYLSRAVGMPEEVISALRNATPIADARLQALRQFAETVVHTRGFASDAAVDAFLAAGFTRAQVLDVVLIIATKTISNYTNHLTHTPKEDFMSDPALGWIAPRNRDKAA